MPVSNGTIQLEWHRDKKILELEFETTEKIHYLQWQHEGNYVTVFSKEDFVNVSDTEKICELIRWAIYT